MSRPQFVCGRTQKRSQPRVSRALLSAVAGLRSPRAMFKFKAKTPSKTPTRPAAADSDDDEDEVQATTARRRAPRRFSLSSGISPTKRPSSSTIDAGERATATLGRRSRCGPQRSRAARFDFLERTDSRSAAAVEDYVLSEWLSERERVLGRAAPTSAARASSVRRRASGRRRASFRRSSTIGAGDDSQESLQSQALQQDMAAFTPFPPSRTNHSRRSRPRGRLPRRRRSSPRSAAPGRPSVLGGHTSTVGARAVRFRAAARLASAGHFTRPAGTRPARLRAEARTAPRAARPARPTAPRRPGADAPRAAGLVARRHHRRAEPHTRARGPLRTPPVPCTSATWEQTRARPGG